MNFRIIAVVLALGLLFTACKTSVQKEEIVNNQSDEQTVLSGKQVSNIIYLDEKNPIAEKLKKSSVYQKALTQNSIVLFDGEPITGGEFAKKLVDTIINEDNYKFYIYEFLTEDDKPKSACCNIFKKEDGKISLGRTYYKDWEHVDEFKDWEELEKILVSDYGYLVASVPDISTSPFCYKVINDREIFENANQNKALEKYIIPLYDNFCCGLKFADISEIHNRWIGVFDSIYFYTDPDNNGGDLHKKYLDDNIPLDTIYSCVSKYFMLSKDELAEYLANEPQDSYTYYNNKKGIYHYRRGQSSEFNKLRITDYKDENGFMKINLERYNYIDGVPDGYKTQLTVKLMEDGTFHYISNLPLDGKEKIANYTEKEKILIKDAKDVLYKATGTLFLYIDEIDCDYEAEPYISENDIEYYPSIQFGTIKDLKNYTRTVFSEDFCNNILYEWGFDEQHLKFIEVDGNLYNSSNSGMGWIDHVLIDSVDIKEITENYAVVTADSENIDGEITNEEFYMVKENGKWVLDSYYNFNI